MDDDSEPGWDLLPHVLYGHAWGIRAFSEAANAVTQKLPISERPGSRKDSGRFAFVVGELRILCFSTPTTKTCHWGPGSLRMTML